MGHRGQHVKVRTQSDKVERRNRRAGGPCAPPPPPPPMMKWRLSHLRWLEDTKEERPHTHTQRHMCALRKLIRPHKHVWMHTYESPPPPPHTHTRSAPWNHPRTLNEV